MKLEYLPLMLIPLWTFIANGIVLVTFCCERNLRNNIANLTIASLTIADFLLAILVLPLAVYFKVNGGWNLGFPLHLIWFCCDVFLSASSIMNLCVISVYRYLAVAYPYRISHTISTKHIIWLLLLAWGISLLVSLALMIETLTIQIPLSRTSHINSTNSLLSIYSNQTEFRSKNSIPDKVKARYMMGDKPFLIYGSILTFYLPLVIMFFTGIRSIQILRRQRSLTAGLHRVMNFGLKPVQMLVKTPLDNGKYNSSKPTDELVFINPQTDCKPDSPCTSSTIRSSKLSSLLPFPTIPPKKSLTNNIMQGKSNILFISTKEKRAIRTLLIVLMFFIVCWLPFFTLQLIFAFGPESWEINEDLFFDLAWPGYVSSGINPVIYAVFHPEYKDAIQRLFKRIFKIA